MAPLDRRVDVLVAIGTAADHRQGRLLALCKAALRLVRPLHRRARAVALRQAEIVAHADLVAVPDDRRPGQCEQQAVGEFEPPLIAVEHRREAAADAAVVELHLLLWAKGGEHNLSFFLGQASEIELVVIAQEKTPLCCRRARLGRLQRLHQRARIGRGERVKQMLVDLKIEHHVHAVAVVAEIFHVGVRQHIGFRQHDRVALPPLQEFAEHAEHVVLLLGLSDVRPLGRDDERHRIHAEPGDAELNPKAHDLEDLGLHLRMRGVEVGLELVKPVEIPGLRLFVVAPGRFLHPRKHHAGVRVRRLLLRPDIPVAVFRMGVAARLLEPGVLV